MVCVVYVCFCGFSLLRSCYLFAFVLVLVYWMFVLCLLSALLRFLIGCVCLLCLIVLCVFVCAC